MGLNQKKILIVDDEVEHAVLLGFLLAENHFLTDLAYSGEEALAKLQQQTFDLVISDVRMGGITGIELCIQTNALLAKPPLFILVTGFSDVSWIDAQKNGVIKIFKKPFDPGIIIDYLNDLFLVKNNV